MTEALIGSHIEVKFYLHGYYTINGIPKE